MKVTDDRNTKGAGLATVGDKLWFLVAYVSGEYLTPLVLDVSHSTPKNRVIIETAVLFGGLGAGIVLGVIGLSFISRRFFSYATHANFAKAFEASVKNRSSFPRKIRRFYFGLVLPRDWPLVKD